MESNPETASDAGEARAVPDALAQYGFVTDPFGPALQEEFFFATQPLQQRLDLILHLVEFSDSVVVVVGDEGCGKSALLRQVRRHAEQAWRTFWIDGAVQAPTAPIWRSLADVLAMRLPEGDPDQARLLLRDRLTVMGASGAITVGVIDNTERLPAETLRQVLDLSSREGAGSALRLVLGIRARDADAMTLPLPEGRDGGLIHRIALPSLTSEQTEAYLQAKFQAVGLEHGSPLITAALDWIKLQAGGNPGRIEALARRVLLSPDVVPAAPWFDPDRLRATLRGIPLPLLAAVSGIAFLFVVAALWLSFDPATETVDRLAELGASTNSFQVELPPPTEVPVAEVGVPSPTPRLSARDRFVPAETKEPPDNAELSEVAIVVERRDVAPVMSGQGDSATAHASQTAITSAHNDEQPGVSVPQVSTPKPPAAPERVSPGHDAAWLLSQSESGYTIQLLAVFDRSALRKFLRQHAIDQAIVIESRREGRPWFIATLGYYPSRGAANAAIARLPAGVLRERPWPRTIRELRAAAP